VKFPALPFALTLSLALPIGPAFADPDARALVRESVDRWGLQTELPDPISGLRGGTLDPNLQPRTELPYSKSAPRSEPPDPKSTPPVERPDANSAPQAGTPNPVVRAPDPAATPRAPPTLIRVLLWGAVIAGVLVAIWSLRNSLPLISRSRKIVAPKQPAPPPAASSRLDEAGLEADDLARQGHFDEAMHLLLLNSLSEMRRQLKTSFAISLTSREILRRVHLPDIGRQSLRAIIAAVERTYFRGDAAGQDDYADCRSNFETLKQSLARVAGT
jgi:hypothetical protein